MSRFLPSASPAERAWCALSWSVWSVLTNCPQAGPMGEQELHDHLHDIFTRHPQVRYDHEDGGQPSLPAHALVHVFQQLAQDLGRDLISDDEQASLQAIVDTAAVDVTVDQVQHIVPHLFPDLPLLAFSPITSPKGRPHSPLSDDPTTQVVFRSRSSSPEPPHPGGKLSPIAPVTPHNILSQMRATSYAGTPSSSPFDVRQRSTPLVPATPGGRMRRPLAIVRRRRSDSASTSGVLSDSEVRIDTVFGGLLTIA